MAARDTAAKGIGNSRVNKAALVLYGGMMNSIFFFFVGTSTSLFLQSLFENNSVCGACTFLKNKNG
ncbi:MAG: hypothetical protein CO103_02260, partial [Chloroflexi bacterium CG_4_9_14_3_um_filter_45_9]